MPTLFTNKQHNNMSVTHYVRGDSFMSSEYPRNSSWKRQVTHKQFYFHILQNKKVDPSRKKEKFTEMRKNITDKSKM